MRRTVVEVILLAVGLLVLGWFYFNSGMVQDAHASDARILEVQGYTEITPLYGDLMTGCLNGIGTVHEATSPAGVRVKVSVCHQSAMDPGFWLVIK